MTEQSGPQRVIQCSPDDGWQGLALALAQARPGDCIRCAPSDFEGSTPLQVPSGVSLEGGVGARLRWSGEGSALVVKDARDVRITALEIEVVGRRVDGPGPPEGFTEALLLVRDAADVQIKGCVVRGGGDTLHGILIHRGRAVLIEECVAEGCRNGIASLASVWAGRANNCLGNAGHGIALVGEPGTSQAPSEAELIANRCRDNQQAGIVFFSAQGRAEANECWGNGQGGIALGRDPRSPQAPSDAQLIANRCDHNGRAGIAFVSSNGRCEGNRCWANQGGDWPEQKRARQDPKLPHLGLLPACQVSIESHDTSVPPSSSVEDERLAARTDKALVEALRDIATPCPTTLADYLGSGCPRCFERFWFGTASTPPETTEVTAERASPVPVDQARCYRLGRSAAGSPSLMRAQPAAKRRTPSPGEDLEADSVASFAAVLSDFVAAWLEGSRWSWSGTPPATTSRGANQDSAGPPGLAWSLALVSVETATLGAELAALRQAPAAHIGALAAQRLQDLADPAVLQPQVGAPLVVDLSAHRFDGRPLCDWLEEALLAEASLDTATAVARTDARAELTHSGPSLWVSLSAGWRRTRGRLTEQIGEILTLPLEVSLGLLLVALGLGLWLACDLGGLAAFKGLVAPDGLHLEPLGAAVAEQWRAWDAVARMKWLIKPTAALLLWVGLLNLALPRALHVRLPLVTHLFDAVRIALLGPLAELPAKLGKTWLGRHFAAAARWCDDVAGRRWLAHRLFGLPWRRPDLALLVLKGVDRLTEFDSRWLLDLTRRRRYGQGFLLVTQVQDLAHVAEGWLPLVLAEHAPWQNCLLLHVPGAASLLAEATAPVAAEAAADPAPRAAVAALGATDDDGALPLRSMPADTPPAATGDAVGSTVADTPEGGCDVVLDALARILGCNHKRETAEACANALADARWSTLDLLPMLMIGSPPMAPMVLIKEAVAEWALYGEHWQREIAPFQALFVAAPDPAASGDQVANLFDYGAHASGLAVQTTRGRPPHWTRLIGHPGERVALAAALRGWLGATPTGDAYLARLVGGGELYHLLRALQAVTCLPWGVAAAFAPGEHIPGRDEEDLGARAALPPAAGRDLPLHLEAALYLLRERLALTASASQEEPTLEAQLAQTLTATLGRAWTALGAALDVPLPPGLWDEELAYRADACRTYVTYLAAQHLLREGHQAPDDTERSALMSALEDSALPAPAAISREAPAPTLRQLFHQEVRRMANRLVVVEPAVAHAILEQRLRQDWHQLPADFKALIRVGCLAAGRRLVRAFLEAPDEPALLAVAASFAQRPALVVAMLCQLARWHQEDGEPGAKNLDGYLAIGRFATTLQARFGLLEPDASAPLPSLQRPPSLEGSRTRLAAERVREADFAKRLIAVLEPGLERRRRNREAVRQMGRIELDGIAFGSRLPAIVTLESLVGVDADA